MGFGGGGGSTGVTAHTHTSAIGNGGELSISETEITNSMLYSRIIIGA
mgnify:CR=1 FL=1